MIKLFHTHGWANLENSELIAECETKEECFKAISNFTKSTKYPNNYSRYCDQGDNKVVIDYGSYYDFLLIDGIPFNKLFN